MSEGLADEVRLRAARRREAMVTDLGGLTALDAPSGDPEALSEAAGAFAALLGREGAAPLSMIRPRTIEAFSFQGAV